ncbi:MAG: hypothetical protein PHH37_02400 [Paludibacter sp.]|nr:hypothetical protein [Paludibacter sp.]
MIINEDLILEELIHTELINIVGGVSIWRYVGMYIRFREEGLDSMSALIAAGGAAYLEN